MQWRRLEKRHRWNLERNLSRLAEARSPLHEKVGDALRVFPWIEIAERGVEICGIRISREGREKIILPPEKGNTLLQQQNQSLHDVLASKKRLLFLSGIGTGHILDTACSLLRQYVSSAVAVIESNSLNWAIYLSLFDAQEPIGHPRVFLFAGNDAASSAAQYARQNYHYLLSSEQISYHLGALPVSQEETHFYVNQVKEIARCLQQESTSFSERLDSYQERVKAPLRRKPQSVWCTAHEEAYIHFPIAQALLQGFQKHGLNSHLQPFTSGFSSSLRCVGSLIDHAPELIVTVNAWPAPLLQDLGLSTDFVHSMEIPRVCWMTDNTSLYEDAVRPEFDPCDWVICIDRTWLSWVGAHTKNVSFLPSATTLEKKGTTREDLMAPISYVGSMPEVLPYIRDLPSSCLDVLKNVEIERHQDSTLDFHTHLDRLRPTVQQRDDILHSARAFCANTSKVLMSERAIIEYFLYNYATYLRRKRTIEAFLPLGLRIYGPPAWKEVLGTQNQDRYRGFVSAQDLPDVYASSEININIHSHQCPTCLNDRDFDVLRAGGVVLGDWVADVERGLLEAGRETLVYHTLDEAVEIARFYLQNHDDRQAIAQQGCERVKREHTFAHRAEAVLEMIDTVIP